MTITGHWRTRTVAIDGHDLDPRPSQRVWNHSPDGFNWGYAGSGPAQLALAILLAAGVDTKRAMRLHQRFTADVIQHWPQTLDLNVDVDVQAWLQDV